VRDFILGLPTEDRAEVVAAMADVRDLGLAAARHIRGDLYEVRASGVGGSFRVLFAPEGRHGQVLLALEAFSKKTQRTPTRMIELALERLRDWRERGEDPRAG
jgi:phage-related protein